MTIYKSLSEAKKAIYHRKSNEVIAIISFNGQAYFIERSQPKPEFEPIRITLNLLSVAKELFEKLKQPQSEFGTRRDNLLKFITEAGIPALFTKEARHAEEKIIEKFENMLSQYNARDSNKKIKTIDIFLTNSPCSESGMRKFSCQCKLNHFFAPCGCDKKLATFFKGYYLSSNGASKLLHEQHKIRIRYFHPFNANEHHQSDDFIKEMDPTLKKVLTDGGNHLVL